jgi:hypothetical protein
MTCAVQQAQALAAALDGHAGVTVEVGSAFYRGAGKAIATPWQFAAGADFLYPETTGPKPFGVNLFNRYSVRINRAILSSPDIQVTMAKVQHLLIPSAVVLRPGLMLRVLRRSRRTRA